MKPWLTEICERVRTTSLVGENDEHWMQAAHALRDAEAVAYCGRCTELLACLIERCDQQDDELARLRRLEEAASTMYYTNHGSPEWDTAYNMLMEAIDEREEAEKVRIA